MNSMFSRYFLIGIAMLAVAGCAKKDPTLLNIKSNQAGPDEFSILPGRPLEDPEDLSALPPPTPGGANRTDANPKGDAVAALGGNPARLNRTGELRGDGGLIAHVTRYGVAPDIRPVLAAEDLEFRRRNDGRVLERLFNVNVYYKAYKRQSLDAYQELNRFRLLGVRTPSAPPSIDEE